MKTVEEKGRGNFKAMEGRKELIRCPECGYIQFGRVEYTVPFYTYIHECKKCKYVIMESEWDKI